MVQGFLAPSGENLNLPNTVKDEEELNEDASKW